MHQRWLRLPEELRTEAASRDFYRLQQSVLDLTLLPIFCFSRSPSTYLFFSWFSSQNRRVACISPASHNFGRASPSTEHAYDLPVKVSTNLFSIRVSGPQSRRRHLNFSSNQCHQVMPLPVVSVIQFTVFFSDYWTVLAYPIWPRALCFHACRCGRSIC
jgi:hypothetical protein